MSARVIACANCGARYKIPETFTGAKARCKACGATIEIATSVVPPAAPGGGKKPAAKPPSKAAPRAAKPAAPKRAASGRAAASSRSRSASKPSARRSARGAKAGDDAAEARPSSRSSSAARSRRGSSRGGRRSGGRAPEGGEEAPRSKAPLWIGVGVVVVAIGATAYFMMGGDKAPAQTSKQEVAKNDATKQAPKNDTATKNDKIAKNDTNAKTTQGKASDSTAAERGKPTPAAAKKPSKKPAKKKPSAKKKKKGVKPFDAKTLGELAYSSDTTDAEKKQYAELAKTAAEESGILGKRAAEKLLKIGRKAFPAMWNALRTIDYMNEDQAMNAFMMHKVFEELMLGNNAGFRPPTPGMPIKQEDAWWNARCLKPLQRFWERNGEADAWAAWLAKRKEIQKKR